MKVLTDPTLASGAGVGGSDSSSEVSRLSLTASLTSWSTLGVIRLLTE